MRVSLTGLAGALACLSLGACANPSVGQGEVHAEPTAALPEPPASSAQGAPEAQPARLLPRQLASASTAPETALGVRDRGIFSDLDARVQLALPARLDAGRVHALFDGARQLLVLYDGDEPIKVYPVLASSVAPEPALLELGSQRLALRAGDDAELAPLLDSHRVQAAAPNVAAPPVDTDGDGIPDPLDVLIGARKTALNADRYDGRYETIGYPLGDVPRSIGVCTDVVIRALRNAGIDLQRDVHDDIVRAPQAYPSVSRPNTNIDHRRVKSLLPYFQRHFEAHTPNPTARDPYRPGDVVFMDTFRERNGAEHVGIVSDRRNADGVPLVINNWTDGTVTTDMDLLGHGVPVTHRFRVLPRASDAPAVAVAPALAVDTPIPADTTQLVVVLSLGFDEWQARVQRYERKPGGSFRRVGTPLSAVLGAAGLGWGDGLHGRGAPPGREGPVKREGDRRSPAGVFGLGTVHGYAATAPGLRLPYRQATADTRCVDDPSSPDYNRIVSIADNGERWNSAEIMRRDDALYELALDIEHNRSPITPGHGSCIFAHVWAGPDVPVTGCTAFAEPDLRRLLEWLKPGKAAWVALPKAEYVALRAAWGLP
ncbi:MAG TPA: DUF1287 domain-containing protein [Polyangiaceae bacterium]|nr:DUF1287 domain-containing protein [Polyangiaceae bacterium]